jgi:hypothetical protein
VQQGQGTSSQAQDVTSGGHGGGRLAGGRSALLRAARPSPRDVAGQRGVGRDAVDDVTVATHRGHQPA